MVAPVAGRKEIKQKRRSYTPIKTRAVFIPALFQLQRDAQCERNEAFRPSRAEPRTKVALHSGSTTLEVVKRAKRCIASEKVQFPPARYTAMRRWFRGNHVVLGFQPDPAANNEQTLTILRTEASVLRRRGAPAKGHFPLRPFLLFCFGGEA